MTPKLRQLRALLAVAQTGRVAKAAVRLNISQPAVTRAIQSLENEIGVTLFDRTRQRIRRLLHFSVASARELLRAANLSDDDLEATP